MHSSLWLSHKQASQTSQVCSLWFYKNSVYTEPLYWKRKLLHYKFRPVFCWLIFFVVLLVIPSDFLHELKHFYSLLCAEQQPRVRGWLLASVDGQTTGLVPANYVKVLGKRRGRRHAEMESLSQVQQGNMPASHTTMATHPQPNPAQGFIPGLGSASSSTSSEELMESLYRETPAPFSLETSNSSVPSSTVLNIPEKTDL